MKISDIPIKKNDERWVVYDCDKVNLLYRKKWTIAGDKINPSREVIFLLEWEIELIVWDDNQIIKEPCKIEVEEWVYVKLLALTDIKFLTYRD